MNLQYIQNGEGTQELEALLEMSAEIASKTEGYANAVEQTALQNTPAIYFNEDHSLGEVFELNHSEDDIPTEDYISSDISCPEQKLSDPEYIEEEESFVPQKQSDTQGFYSDSESIDPYDFDEIEIGYEREGLFEEDTNQSEGTFAENQLEAELSKGALKADMDRAKYLAERVEKEIVI